MCMHKCVHVCVYVRMFIFIYIPNKLSYLLDSINNKCNSVRVRPLQDIVLEYHQTIVVFCETGGLKFYNRTV